jgi:hypothetical protein
MNKIPDYHELVMLATREMFSAALRANSKIENYQIENMAVLANNFARVYTAKMESIYEKTYLHTRNGEVT